MGTPTWRQALDAAHDAGFAAAALLPAHIVPGYRPNAEAQRQRIGTDPSALLEGAKSILVAALPFAWLAPWPDGTGQVSAFYFASQRAHEAILRVRDALLRLGVRVSVHQSLPLKRLGAEAGFGLQGRNSLLSNDRWGSCFALRMLVTDLAPGALEQPLAAKPCGDCRACIDACPTGALLGDGQLDTALCLRSHMLSGTVIPLPLRRRMGTMLLGCERCQRVCPRNAAVGRQPCVDPAPFSLERLLVSDSDTMRAIAAHLGRNEARKQRIQAQAALLCGNSGDRMLLPLLRPLAAHERPAIAEHALWAIDQLERG